MHDLKNIIFAALYSTAGWPYVVVMKYSTVPARFVSVSSSAVGPPAHLPDYTVRYGTTLAGTQQSEILPRANSTCVRYE